MSPDLPSLSIAWIDTVGLVLVGVMLLLGAFRGLWWQVIRLVGLVGAVVAARALSPRLAPTLAELFPDLPARVAYGSVWFGVFLAGLAAATLLGVVGRKLLETMQLGLVDRAGGALVGMLTGALVHVALVAALSQLAPEAWVSEQIGGTYSEVTLEAANGHRHLVLGPEAAGELERLFRPSGDAAPPAPASAGSVEPAGNAVPVEASSRTGAPRVH